MVIPKDSAGRRQIIEQLIPKAVTGSALNRRNDRNRDNDRWHITLAASVSTDSTYLGLIGEIPDSRLVVGGVTPGAKTKAASAARAYPTGHRA